MESNTFSFSFKFQVHSGAGATTIKMPLSMAGIYIFASLISGVSAAMILASGSGHTEARSLEGPAHHAKRGPSTYESCRAGSCVYLNSPEDFCLWAPSLPVLSANRNREVTERTLLAWCMKGARGANLIPDGTISGARLVRTSAYVQITGVGDLSKINVPADGVASASGESNTIHNLVFTSGYGQLEQIDHWTSFVSQERFCFRACKSSAAASTACAPIRDISECSDDILGNHYGIMLDDYTEGATEAPFVPGQEAFTLPSHHYGSPDTAGGARITRVRRAIPSPSGSTSTPISPFSPSQSSLPEQTVPLTSSTVTTPTATATTITFPSFPTSTLNTTVLANSTTRTSTISSNSSTSMLSFHNHTQTRTHRHSHTLTRSHSHSSTSIFVSSWSLNTSFHPSWFSSTAYSFSYPSPPASSTPTFPTNSSAMLSSLSTSTSSLITIFAPSPAFTFTSTSTAAPSPPSSYTSSSSYSQPFSSQSVPLYSSSASSAPLSTPFPTSSISPSGFSSQPSPSYDSSAPSTATPTSSPVAPSTSSSQTSDVLTFTSQQSPYSSPVSSSSPASTSPATSSSTSPNSQTQVGSQCPPPSRRANAAVSLAPLMCTILMVVISPLASILFV